MPRRKPLRKCILKHMEEGLTRKEATNKCKKVKEKNDKKICV